MLQNLNMKSFFREQSDCRASVNSFKFYVPASIDNKNYHNNDQSILEEPKPDLHKGEIIITGGPRVLLFPNVSERTKGLTGSIYITNFRLIFDTFEDNRTSEEECLHQRNFLFGEYSVCLTNIDSVYQISGDKKRRLLPDSLLAAKIKGLQIVCKNMKVLTFSFDQSPINVGKDVTKTLLHHAFPGKHELLFGYDYREDRPSSDKHSRDVVMFSQRHDWEDELTRTCSQSASKWRLSSQNQTFQLSSSLPKWLIIPHSVVDCDLATASYSFRCNRPPVWTWSSPNGAALVRMADLLPTVTDRTQENRMLENIRKCHPHLKGPSIKYLDKDLPSIKDLLQSYSKLRELCIPGVILTMTDTRFGVLSNTIGRTIFIVANQSRTATKDSQRQFKVQDSHFYSLLDNTKWLQYVSSCLRIAVEAAREIQDGTTVVLQELEGRDTSAIVSSLVQLILDPHTRSITGFQSLIQKEWVALGHPFCKRLGHLRNDDSERSPVFLLFLDCVWQLIQQFPSSFEFTDTYLTTLWDSVHISVFDTFLFDCEKDRLEAFESQVERFTPRSVWNWSNQFSSNDIQFFANPLYKFSKMKAENQNPRSKALNDDVLLPEYNIRYMEIWSQCYFRWLPVLSIKCGGLPQIDVIHRQLLNEINTLTRYMSECSKGNVGNGVISNRNSINNNNNINSSDKKKSCPETSRSREDEEEEDDDDEEVRIGCVKEERNAADFVSVLFHKRDLLDNFFPFSIDSTSYVSNPFANSSNLSEFDSQSVLNLTE